ncbi:MAG: TraB/GumN family protein [Flavobacterium sp.]
MTTSKTLILGLVAVASFSFSTQAQTKKANENSLLWEISGNGLARPSYLYGTLHLMCERDFAIQEKVKKAFDKATKLALELDFDDPSELKAMQEMGESKVALSTLLTPEDYKKLDILLKEKVGAGASQFEHTTLISLMSLIMIKSLDCPPKVYELEFFQMAQKRKMEILGLEKLAVQIAAMDASFPPHEMVEQLRNYDKKYFDVLTQTYKSEDLKAIYELVNDPKFMDEKSKPVMLDNRNSNWLKDMPAMMKNESVFFAVGAAHLPGKKGVIQLLQKAGYTVQPITN